jgi:hypothetical protein
MAVRRFNFTAFPPPWICLALFCAYQALMRFLVLSTTLLRLVVLSASCCVCRIGGFDADEYSAAFYDCAVVMKLLPASFLIAFRLLCGIPL